MMMMVMLVACDDDHACGDHDNDYACGDDDNGCGDNNGYDDDNDYYAYNDFYQIYDLLDYDLHKTMQQD